jgi:O-antigen biosynthesis protein
MMQVLDVIIPVYKGLKEVRACLESVLNAPVKLTHDIIVINDASPDADIHAYLKKLAAQKHITLITNKTNLGFVATVNKGMTLHAKRDVVLLNSDTVVANDWLDRLHASATQDKRIGTVTPFSNNATICSYPNFCASNPILAGWTVDKIDAVFRRVHPDQIIDIPTGVGFCMYIKRACLNEIGLFDVDNFGRGYGEENDFCMRAAYRGWRNVIASDIFVYHAGSVSFGTEQRARIDNAMAVMDKLHPNYHGQVHQFIQHDPLKKTRQALDWNLLCADDKLAVLCIDHGETGGTIKHIYELAQLFRDNINFLRLYPSINGLTRLSWLNGNQNFDYYNDRKELLNLYFNLPTEIDALIAVLKAIGIRRIHYHHTLGLSPVVWGLPERLGVKYDYTLHDYYAICPQISLTQGNRYCEETGEESCHHCLQQRPAPGHADIQTWRSNYHGLLKNAARVFAPSDDVAQRIQHCFQDISVVVSPHPDLKDSNIAPVLPLHVAPGEALRIAVIGALSPIKGADLLEKAALHAKQQKLALEFYLLGCAYRSLSTHPKSQLYDLGTYNNDAELQAQLTELKPHVAWFPAQWPETYSYTLSAVLATGLPIVSTDLGAFHERIAGRAYSWVLPNTASAREWNKLFSQLQQGNSPPCVAAQMPRQSNFSYLKDYPADTPADNKITISFSELFLYTKTYRSSSQNMAFNTKKFILNMISACYRIKLVRSLITRSISLPLRTRLNKWLAG